MTEYRFENLRALIFQEGDRWVAQALSHDLNASGKTEQEAHGNLLYAIAACAAMDVDLGNVPWADVPPAPQVYLDGYDAAQEPIHFPQGSPFVCKVGDEGDTFTLTISEGEHRVRRDDFDPIGALTRSVVEVQ